MTRPDAPAGRGRPLQASPGRRARRRARHRGADARPTPRDPDFLARLRRARPRLLPGGRLRRARAAGRARRPAARLGQPALLAAAGVARRRTGAARRAGTATTSPAPPPSCSRRASTPARCYGVVTETVRADDTSGDLLDRLADVGRRAARRHDGRPRRRRARRRAAARRRRVASRRRSPSTTPGSTGRCPRPSSTGWSARARPAPGAWTTFRGERLKLGPVRLLADDAGARAGRAARRQAPGARRHRDRTRCVLGEVRPHGQEGRWPAADWARGVRIEPGALDDSARDAPA